jgi:hypothetical protein
MSQASVHKKFIFNSKIDGNWLFSLYEDDYAYIIEVFVNSLDTIKEEAASLSTAYEADDISTLRKATHKLKPVFGFSGLLDHQDQVSRFEHACMNKTSVANLTMQYIELTDVIHEGKAIIQEEYNRLKAFTA